jgi:N-terminal domain of NWD NACHT-NTPase/NACHT domain
MDWYCSVSDHLLGKSSRIDMPTLSSSREELKKRIIRLYEAILLYQIRSVCSYYQNQGWEFLRGFITLDDWDGDLRSITKTEEELKGDSNVFAQLQFQGLLEQLVIRADDAANVQRDIERDKLDRECLRSLFVVDPIHQMQNLVTRKEHLIPGVSDWVLLNNKFKEFSDWTPEAACNRILWIRGHAGSGKTMLMMRIIQELGRWRTLPGELESNDFAFYFFQGYDDESLSSATTALRCIVWSLLRQQPRLIVHLRKDFDTTGEKAFSNKFTFEFLAQNLRMMLRDPELDNAVIALDAMDECKDGLAKLLSLILEALTLTPKVRWLLSSRPRPDIDSSVHRWFKSDSTQVDALEGTAKCLVLELNSESLSDPVEIYIKHKMDSLRAKDWEETHFQQVFKYLTKNATRTFLWVWLVCKELTDAESYDIDSILKNLPTDLGKTYERILDCINREKRDDPIYCKKVLTAATLAYRPLAVCKLEMFSGLPANIPINKILPKCRSFLTIDDDTVYFIHQSAQDFLKENINKLTEDLAQVHKDFVKYSVKAMSSLKRDIYDSQNYGYRLAESSPPDHDPLASIGYSCVFWLDHLRHAIEESPESSKDLYDDGFMFLKEHFLHWLESLSLLHELSAGIASIKKLMKVIQICTSTA